MFMIGGEPQRTQFDLNFSIAGFPIRVHPLFWLMGLILGAGSGDGFLILMWIGVLFVSIVIHELGHAFAMRRFGGGARIVLYMMGGLAIPEGSSFGMSFGKPRTSREQIIISAAGPGAGFIFAGVIVAVLYAVGGGLAFNPNLGAENKPDLFPVPFDLEMKRGASLSEWLHGVPDEQRIDEENEDPPTKPGERQDNTPDSDETQEPGEDGGNGNHDQGSDGSEAGGTAIELGDSLDKHVRSRGLSLDPIRLKLYTWYLFYSLLMFNIFWGLINLLPVYPLDGGHIAREVFVNRDPWNGLRKSLQVSLISGIAAAVLGFALMGSFFMALLFGSLAFSSWQMLQQVSGRGGPGGGRGW